MEQKHITSSISKLSFLSALAFYAAIGNAVANISPAWLQSVIQFLASIGLYEAVFEISLRLYNKYFYKIFDRAHNFEQDWYQVFVVNEYEDRVRGIRHGPVKMTASPEKIFLSGENYRLDGSFSSSWQSEFVNIDGDKMILLYISEGTRRQNSITRGIMTLHILGSPPATLTGSFTDAAPATHSGPIHIFRDKTEYEKKLEFIKQSISN